MSRPLEVVVVGSDTGVGKTMVTTLLVRGLRAQQRRVWVHKPVACPMLPAGLAEDAALLEPLADPAQPRASVVPIQLTAAAAPNVAAAAEGRTIEFAALQAHLAAVRGPDHDLVVEGVGGIAVSLCSDRRGLLELLSAEAQSPRGPLAVVLVVRPHLGTLNHSLLSVRELRRHRLSLLGLVVNEHAPVDQRSLPVVTARSELEALCAAPVLAWIPHGKMDDEGRALAAAVWARAEEC